MTAERLEALYRQLAPLVRARARRVLGAEADDIVQDTFLRLIAADPADHQLSGWVYATATNLCLDRLRHGARREGNWQRDVATLAESRSGGDAEALLTSRERCRALLGGLDRRTQLVAVLTYFDEMTQDEVADRLGLSRRTIAEELRRVRDAAQIAVQA